MKLIKKNRVLFIVVAILLLLGISRILLNKIALDKRTSPAAEKKLATHRLPEDIKKELQKTSSIATFRVPILLYHYVEYVKDKGDTIRQSLNINPYIFEKQIQTLKDAGYTFITVGELGKVLDAEMSLPRKPVIITFDDGYEDFYTDVLPLLKKYNVKATAYIVAGAMGRLNYMSKDEIGKAIESGLVEIGAHSMYHRYLKGISYNEAKFEIEQSKANLEQEFGVSVVSFAYPYGAFDKQAVKFVQDAGFKTSVSTVPGIDVSDLNRYFIFRIRPGARTGIELLQYLEGNSFKEY
ncbi:MAG: polysaccharide deacetylase family protein [Candidatus Levybacteria bacterium]|nr:polysaccharide deacetylase family protein [Candidatus Levybacteria bacterium]